MLKEIASNLKIREQESKTRLPDEVTAMRAVGRLAQVGGHELVSVDLVDPPADRALPFPRPHALPEHAFLIFTGC